MVSSSSGGSRRYRGVRQRQWGSWVSEIRHSISKTRIWLGTFDTAKKAAKAYDEAARVMEGENAKTNFPLPSPSSSSLLSPSVRAKLMHCNCMATLRGPTNNYNVMTNNNHMKYNASSGTSGHITKFKASKVTSYTNNSHKHKDEQYNDGYRSHGGSMTMTSGAHVYTNGHHDPRTLSSDGRYGNGRTLGSKSGAGQYRGQTLVCLRLDDAADRLGVMWQGSADSKPQWVTTIHVPPPPPLPQVHSMTLSSTTFSTTNSNIFGSSSSSSSSSFSSSSSSDSEEAPKHDIYPRPKNSSCPADQVSPTISSSSSTTTSMVSTGNLDILLDATFDFSGHIPTTPRTTLLLPNHSPPTSCYEDEDDSMMMDHIDLIDLIYDSPQLGASPNLDILDNHHHHHHDGGDDMALMDPLQLGAEASISQALLYLAQAGVEEEDHHHHHHHRHTFHQNQLDDDEDDGEHMYHHHHHHHHHHHNPFPFLEEYNCHEEEDQLWQ